MTLQRRHFELIAEAIRDAYKGSLNDISAQGACLAVAIHMCDKLQHTNPGVIILRVPVARGARP